MTSKQKRLNIELHRKVSLLTEKTKDFLKASQAAVVGEVQCEIAGHSKGCPHLVITPSAHRSRVRSWHRAQTSSQSPGGEGKRSQTQKGRAGEGGLRTSPPVATKAAEASHSIGSSDCSAVDRFGSFPPHSSVSFFNNQRSGSRRQPALLQSTWLHCHQYSTTDNLSLKNAESSLHIHFLVFK